MMCKPKLVRYATQRIRMIVSDEVLIENIARFPVTLSVRSTRSGEGDAIGGDGGDSSTGVITESKSETKKPSMYKVLMLNDDYTPMEFVVQVLQSIFAMDRSTATRIMLEVHTKGKGVCGVYTFEIAETKVAQVVSLAEQHQHPLLCTMEET